MTGHGITWEQVDTHGTTADLAVGVTWVKPTVLAAYQPDTEGPIFPNGRARLDGTAWTVEAMDGDMVTAVSHDGRRARQTLPPRPIGILIKK